MASPLTRNLNPASPVGTEVIQTKVPDNSLANLVQNTASTGTQFKATEKAIEGRQASKAVDETVAELDDQMQLDPVVDVINQELGAVEKVKRAESQGRAGKDKFTIELDSRMKKLKSRFPGHIDVIDARARKVLGFDPRQASREIIFRESEDSDEALARRYGNAAVQFGTEVFVNGDPTQGTDWKATALKTQERVQLHQDLDMRMKLAAASGTTRKTGTGLIGGAGTGVEPVRLNQISDLAFDTVENEVDAIYELAFANDGTLDQQHFGLMSTALNQLESRAIRHLEESPSYKEMSTEQTDYMKARITSEVDTVRKTINNTEATLPTTQAVSDAMKVKGSAWALKKMPFFMMLNNTTGGQASNAILSTMLTPEKAVELSEVTGNEFQGFIEGLTEGDFQDFDPVRAEREYQAAFLNVLVNGNFEKADASMSEGVKPVVLKDVWKFAQSVGGGVVDDKGLVPWGNAWQYMSTKHRTEISNVEGNLETLVKNTLKPAFSVNLDRYGTVDPVGSEIVKGYVSNIYGEAIFKSMKQPSTFLFKGGRRDKLLLKGLVYDSNREEFTFVGTPSSIVDPVTQRPLRQGGNLADELEQAARTANQLIATAKEMGINTEEMIQPVLALLGDVSLGEAIEPLPGSPEFFGATKRFLNEDVAEPLGKALSSAPGDFAKGIKPITDALTPPEKEEFSPVKQEEE